MIIYFPLHFQRDRNEINLSSELKEPQQPWRLRPQCQVQQGCRWSVISPMIFTRIQSSSNFGT